MKQRKPTTAETGSSFLEQLLVSRDPASIAQLRKVHDDLHAVGQKAMECVPMAKVQALATEFFRGMRDAPDAEFRALDAMGYAADVLLFTPSMSGHTAIDRAMRTSKINRAQMEAANLFRQPVFRLFEITKDLGEGLLSAKDLVSNETLTIFDPDSPLSRGGRWARRTCSYQGVHITVGPVLPLNDDLLAVAAPFMDNGRLKKQVRCSEVLYEHFIQHGNPLDGIDPALLSDEEDNDDDFDDAFPFDASDGPLHALAADWAEESQLPEPTADVLALIRTEAYELPIFEMHRAWYHAHHGDLPSLAAAYQRILSLQLETLHRRTSAGIRTSLESLDHLAAKLREGATSGEIPEDAVAHFEELCRRAKLAGTAKTNKGAARNWTRFCPAFKHCAARPWSAAAPRRKP